MRGIVHMIVSLGGTLVFTHWLPFEESAIHLPGDEHRPAVRIWVDTDCLDHITQITPQDVPFHVNLKVGRIHLTVDIGTVPDELASFITSGRRRGRAGVTEADWSEADREFERQYVELGERVHAAAVAPLRRLMEFARVQSGQYWLEPQEFGSAYSLAINSRATVRFDDGAPREWLPPSDAERRHFTMGGNESRYVSASGWLAADVFVKGSCRPTLVLELLVGAEELNFKGHTRAGLVEAVAALEVALARFCKCPNRERLSAPAEAACIELAGLPRLREKLGLRGTLDILIPLLIDDLSVAQLELVRKAVAVRGNVVHQGQRSVARCESTRLIDGIRQMCAALSFVTAGSGPEEGYS